MSRAVIPDCGDFLMAPIPMTQNTSIALWKLQWGDIPEYLS
jgi:hypothetical protein